MEELLQLYDVLWFERGVLSAKMGAEPMTGGELSVDLNRPASKMSRVRSSSDQNIPSLNMNMLSEADSPISVLRRRPKLQTVISGKEFGELEVGVEKRAEKGKVVGRGRRRRKSGRSKSLTELEFEEVKGFMDLGFVFSEEDHKDSSLVSMIPGLQRLGHQNDDCHQSAGVSRPYLSEAWRRCERGVKTAPRVSLRVGGVVDDLEMKHQIKFWAHSVASAVR